MLLDTVITPGGDLLHGSDVTWSAEGGVLHFMVGYNHNILREMERNPMETLTIREDQL